MNVFFVCTGNACRSPLAACILKKKLEDRGIEASVASAGTLDGDVILEMNSMSNSVKKKAIPWMVNQGS